MQIFNEISKYVVHMTDKSISSGWDYQKSSSNQHTTVPIKLLSGPQILNQEVKTKKKSQWLYN